MTLSLKADISQAHHLRIQCGLGRGNGGVLPRACRQEVNKVGLLWTVDPSLLDDTMLTGDTSLSLAQVVLCLCRMLTMVPSGQAQDPEISLPWHTDWFSSAELGFPLVADQYHRDAHPLIRQYVCSQIGGGDLTLGSLLRFRGGIGNDHCEICDHSTCRGSLIIAIAASRQENLDSLRESEIRGHSFGRRVLH